jgi:chromosome partitioning protein
LTALHPGIGPLNENGRRRAAARQEWFAAPGSPLEVHDFIGA